MSEKAQVFESELEALKANRAQDRKLFSYPNGDATHFVVAVSEHAATIALTKFLQPLTKISKAAQQDRYVTLIESALDAATVSKPEERDHEDSDGDDADE